VQGTLAQTLKSVKPTNFMAVPRVWEKMHQKIQLGDENRNAMSKKLLQLCQKIGFRTVEGLSFG